MVLRNIIITVALVKNQYIINSTCMYVSVITVIHVDAVVYLTVAAACTLLAIKLLCVVTCEL